MKTLTAVLAASLLISVPAFAGDAAAGRDKATGCIVCHGNETVSGIFYTLQLAGRNADKLAIKSNKYKTGKIIHPIMNAAMAFYTEKEIEDISAYYQSLGKPSFTSPLFTIKGDDDVFASN